MSIEGFNHTQAIIGNLERAQEAINDRDKIDYTDRELVVLDSLHEDLRDLIGSLEELAEEIDQEEEEGVQT